MRNRIGLFSGTIVDTCVIVLGTLLLLAGNAGAQGGPMQVMDDDGDGRISADEWRGPPAAFGRGDVDGNGYVTADELRALKGGGVTGKSGKSLGTAGALRQAAPVTDASGFQIIDTHVHFGAGKEDRNFVAGASEALSKILQRKIATAIVLPTPQVGYSPDGNRYDYTDLRNVAHENVFTFGGGSGLFGELLHGKSSVSDSEKAAFRSIAQKMVVDGIVVFGEIGLNHYGIPRLGNHYGTISLKHPLLRVLGDIAATSGIPIDVHFDIVPEDTRLPKPLSGAGNPEFLEENIAAFETFLSENRGAKIVWAHAGFEAAPFRSADLNARLLSHHPNLYMSIRLISGSSKPSAAMDESKRLKSEWRNLFIAYADRFVLGSESMYGSSISDMLDAQFTLFQSMLAALPADVARKIASENARRIYRLDER